MPAPLTLETFIDVLDYHSLAEAELNYQTNGQEQDADFNYKLTNKANPFSDFGAWHGMYLPQTTNNSFFGPLILDQEIPVNAGQYCSNYLFYHHQQLLAPTKQHSYSLPGKLIIDQTYEHFSLHKELIFINHRSSMVKTEIINHTNTDLDLELKIQGIAYQQVKYSSKNAPQDWKQLLKSIAPINNGFTFQYTSLVNSTVAEQFSVVFANPIKDFKCHQSKNEWHYQCELPNIVLKAKQTSVWYEQQQFDFNHHSPTIDLHATNTYWTDNHQRWTQYLNNLTNHVNQQYWPLAVKCLQTLIMNWRSPAGVLKHDFIIPSITYTDFIGAWSWDTWKLAVGVSLFDCKLAANCIENMFDYQITSHDQLRPQDVGMIPDCIFFNQHSDRNGVGGNWNERNTKPSIAAWSVLFLYEQGLGIDFLKRVYPKIKAYNQWWNHNRSYNRDNILQFGATVDKLNNWDNQKTIIEAAAWESGMDNAPRFDWVNTKALQVFNDQHKLIGYVIDQASVDLNAFNYLELISLAKIAKLLHLENEAKAFLDSANNVKTWINQHCYDAQLKCYFDVKLKDNTLVNVQGKGDECLVCLFAQAADEDKAQAVIKNLSPANYLTHVCFPSVAADSLKFEPTNYWRGPVWLDQWYFGLKGLSNYAHRELAHSLFTSSLQHMQGLLSQGCVKENYNPLDGVGLATTNFSWAASMILIGLKEFSTK